VLAGLSPYWAMPAMPGSAALEVSVWDLRTGEKKLLGLGPVDVISPVRIAGNVAAWVTRPMYLPLVLPGGSMPYDIHLADISTGTARVVVTGAGDDLTQHFLASFALNDRWLVWLEPRGAHATPNAAGQRVNEASDGFDLVGFHLPDLTPFRVPSVVKVGEGVSELGGVLQLGDDAAVFVVNVMPPQPQKTTVRMVDLRAAATPTSPKTAGPTAATTTTTARPTTSPSILSSKAIVHLSTFTLNVSPRPGVRVQIWLDQSVGSQSVSPRVTVDNQSSTAYIVTEKDFGLFVEGSGTALKAIASPHMPGSALPGEVTEYNGFTISLPTPTSRIVGFNYTSYDPGGKGSTYSVGFIGQ
jgi:hypothetical protein